MWLGVSLIVGFIGWSKSINVVFLLAYFMLSVLVLNGIVALLNVRRVRVVQERRGPFYAGEDSLLRLSVTNASSRSATVIVDDTIVGEVSAWLIHDLPANGTVSCFSRRVFANRGRFTALARISSASPIGLISIIRTAEFSEVTILPALGVMDPDGFRRWIHHQARTSDRGKRVLRLTTTDQADVRGVRPYRPGDQIRSIHWRISAHRREFMVREYDSSPSSELILVVEPWLPRAPTQEQLNDLESALSLAATIASSWCRVYETRVILFVAGQDHPIGIATPSDGSVREALIPLAQVSGGFEFEAPDSALFTRSLLRAARLVISSRQNTPYASLVSKSTGCSFVAVCPKERPPWYRPPPKLEPSKQNA